MGRARLAGEAGAAGGGRIAILAGGGIDETNVDRGWSQRPASAKYTSGEPRLSATPGQHIRFASGRPYRPTNSSAP